MAFLCLAIPTMKRWKFLKQNLPVMLERPEVAEIVICDETGEDVDEIQKSPLAQNKKLRLYKNEKRLGIYHNKRKALSLATAPWVAIIDSDNTFPESWFERLDEVINQQNNPKMIYGSASFQSINLSTGIVQKHCESFEGTLLDKKTWNQIIGRYKWNFLLNDGNWVVHKSAIEFLPEKVLEGYDGGAEFCDAIYSLRLLIQAGYSIWYVPELTYIHTVHNESSWLTTERASTIAFNTTNWYL
jgi:glycosyltransferase involved in cell wall biosynthesis